jgi:DNA polymerase III alpha subunit
MGRALLPSPVHVLAAVRARCSLDDLAGYLPSWAGGYLRGWAEMAHRFAPWPGAVEAAARLGDGLAFDLQLIAPALPPFPVPGMAMRWPTCASSPSEVLNAGTGRGGRTRRRPTG